jgi:solute carrier family 25 iron transporter 28/37
MQVFATTPAAVYTGMGNAFTRISSTEGMRALWRGVSSVILGAGPAHAVHFGTYEAVKELAGANEAGNHWVATCEFSISLGHRLLFHLLARFSEYTD